VAEREAHTEHAKDAMRRQSWAEAYEELRALDPSALAAEDLEALADAAWWLSKAEESMSPSPAAGSRARSGTSPTRPNAPNTRSCRSSSPTWLGSGGTSRRP
jgi:Ser/Thr protein kinase RdoA (MazF antagonist)